MITGERGIGKTSLLLYLKALAQGNIDFNSIKFKFLVLDLDIDTNSTQLGIIHRIQMRLDNQLGKDETAKNISQRPMVVPTATFNYGLWNNSRVGKSCLKSVML